MRKFALLMALTASGAFSFGASAQQVTVAQLQDFLVQQQSAHKSDNETARLLSSAELTEQLTDSTLERFKSDFGPGAKTLTELNLLADLSAFRDPPAPEVLRKDPPDAEAQKTIIEASANFATVTLGRLPDFLATRTTSSFEDVPVFTRESGFQSGMHPTGTFVREVTYRNGLEFSKDRPVAPGSGQEHADSQSSLSSAGEFGPVLATILRDSTRGKIAWDHWEQTSTEPVAVFRYEVPKSASHYKISFCCAWNETTQSLTSYNGQPAYRGSISIEPSTGAVMRLTLVAALEDFQPTLHFGLFVRYGKVEIGGSSLICPLRSAVILQSTREEKGRAWNDVHVNDMSFTGYRRFGSTARVVPNAATK